MQLGPYKRKKSVRQKKKKNKKKKKVNQKSANTAHLKVLCLKTCRTNKDFGRI